MVQSKAQSALSIRGFPAGSNIVFYPGLVESTDAKPTDTEGRLRKPDVQRHRASRNKHSSIPSSPQTLGGRNSNPPFEIKSEDTTFPKRLVRSHTAIEGQSWKVNRGHLMPSAFGNPSASHSGGSCTRWSHEPSAAVARSWSVGTSRGRLQARERQWGAAISSGYFALCSLPTFTGVLYLQL